MALAAPGFAAEPNAGANCQSTGKINGRGATFQTNAQMGPGFTDVPPGPNPTKAGFSSGFQSDVCGPVSGSDTETGSRMVIYNYADARTRGLTGSGSGINGARCRTDAFNGTDVPYTRQQLTDLRAAPPLSTAAPCTGAFQALIPPFQPTPAPFPAAADVQAPVLSFPVAGGAVGIGVNLPDASCGGAAPSVIQLNGLQASRLFGGQIANWSTDAALRAIQPDGGTALSNCNVAVTRVVRSDNSGTTTIFKNYFDHADGTRALCDGSTWHARLGQGGGFNATGFPTGAGCSAGNPQAGNPAVVNTTAGIAGAVGYGDLSDWLTLQPQVVLANLLAQTGGASNYVEPASGSGSNCAFTGASLPTGGSNGAVGLNADVSATWASDPVDGGGNPLARARGDVTFLGSGYPICGFTWDLVFTGLSRNGASATANSRLTSDQRRTLYSYMTYVLSPLGQARLNNAGYAPLPSSFLTTLRSGFQNNF